MLEYDKPYWIGYCDIPNRCEFKTAEEMFEAKVFDGTSIKERWDEIVVYEIGRVPTEDWIKHHSKDLK